MTSRSIHSVITRVSVFMQSSALTCSACTWHFQALQLPSSACITKTERGALLDTATLVALRCCRSIFIVSLSFSFGGLTALSIGCELLLNLWRPVGWKAMEFVISITRLNNHRSYNDWTLHCERQTM